MEFYSWFSIFTLLPQNPFITKVTFFGGGQGAAQNPKIKFTAFWEGKFMGIATGLEN